LPFYCTEGLQLLAARRPCFPTKRFTTLCAPQRGNWRRSPFAKLSDRLGLQWTKGFIGFSQLFQLHKREALVTERLHQPGMVPRLLPREAAATFCGRSPIHFDQHISPTVPSLRVGKRNHRDVKSLDPWLALQLGLAHTTRPVDD
jgi:hypothetical protein